MPFISTSDGASLYYDVHGNGPHTLFFIHGLTLDHRMWQPQVEYFAPCYRVITYDCRGFGRSSVPGEQPYQHADDIVAILNHANVEKAIVCGLSMGGRIAGQMAVLYPDRIAGVVFIDAGLDGVSYSSELRAETYDAVDHAYATHGLTAAKTAWLQSSLFAPAQQQPQVASALREMVNDYSGWHWRTKAPSTISIVPPVCERLAGITAPTLVLVGELDTPDFQDIANVLATKIAHAHKVVIPQAGHLASMEHPSSVNAAIERFLQQLPEGNLGCQHHT